MNITEIQILLETMRNLKASVVTAPVEHLPQFDLTVVFQWAIGAVSAVWSFSKGTDAYFKHKKSEKEEFIKTVVIASVNATMEGALREVNLKIDTLFDYREKDRENSDRKFSDLMKEVKR